MCDGFFQPLRMCSETYATNLFRCNSEIHFHLTTSCKVAKKSPKYVFRLKQDKFNLERALSVLDNLFRFDQDGHISPFFYIIFQTPRLMDNFWTVFCGKFDLHMLRFIFFERIGSADLSPMALRNLLSLPSRRYFAHSAYIPIFATAVLWYWAFGIIWKKGSVITTYWFSMEIFFDRPHVLHLRRRLKF